MTASVAPPVACADWPGTAVDGEPDGMAGKASRASPAVHCRPLVH